MGTAFLDRHGIKSGIKLNDVIEEYRYVAAGKSVKKGDLLTYVGEDVAPAIEPPFNAVALSSGVGAPEFVEVEVEKEVTKTGNIFPTTWTATDRLNATSSDGYEIKANSSSNTTDYAYYVSDGNTNTSISSKPVTTSNYSWQITMTCPKPTKITKMKTYIYTNGSNFSIRGSMDNSTWTTLYSTTSSQTSLSEIILDKTDFYSYYRINCTVVTDGVATVREWQTSEYVEVEKEIQQIPSTEHNEQVKIARVYKEVEVTKLIQGDIIPKTWTKVSNTEYIADDNIVLTSDSIYSGVGSSYPLTYIADNKSSTAWWSATEDNTGSNSHWVKIKFVNPVKITKMKTYVREVNTAFVNAIIQGSNDDSQWVDLFTISSYQTALTEITLDNPDYYQYYRIYGTVKKGNLSAVLAVYEWQCSEYEDTVTEVIQ